MLLGGYDLKENYIALREKQVVKANDLIQKSHFSLSLLQQKIVLYLISQIEYNDKDFRLYEFDIREFCKVCGIDFDNGGNYNYLKEQIKEIADKSLWITIEDEETLLRWITKPYINRKEGVIKIRLDEDMKPFLLQLKANFTQYELIYTLHFKSKYTIRLYELIKSIHYHDLEPYERIYTVEELKKLLDAEVYKTYQHFREKVLDKAIAEINEYSDKIVSYEPIKIGRRIGKIKLKVETKETLEMLKIRAQIDREMEFDPNQITFWDNEIKGGNGK